MRQGGGASWYLLAAEISALLILFTAIASFSSETSLHEKDMTYRAIMSLGMVRHILLHSPPDPQDVVKYI
jgi:hypothetical protein